MLATLMATLLLVSTVPTQAARPLETSPRAVKHVQDKPAAAASTDRVLAYNPTPHARQQVIVFGIPKGTAPAGSRLLLELPTVEIRTARVTIPAHHNGYVDVDDEPPAAPEPDLTFGFSKGLDWSLREGTKSVAFKEVTPFASNKQMVVRHYVAKDSQGMIGHLIVYQGFGEDWCRYEYVMALESLHAPSKEVKAGLGVGAKARKFVAIDRLLGDITTWKGYQGVLKDRQGFGSFGTVVGLPGPKDTPASLATKQGQLVSELTCCGRFDRWGPWSTVPRGTHKDRKPNNGLLDHRGVILEKGAGRTGDQFGFGVVKHLDSLRPGQLQNLAHDRAAVIQEVCRPIWVFEPDGAMPSRDKHPKFVSWDETWHWHKGIGIDRFGRDYKHGGFYTGWSGMDRQHYSAVALSEDVLLRGGFLSRLILQMKLFHYLTEINYPPGGRALGRYMFAARDLYVATGDKRIVETVREKWLPTFKKSWKEVNGHWVKPEDVADRSPIAMRLYNNDPHTKIPGLEWICWEDGIAIQGLDVLWPMLDDPEVLLATYLLARSLVLHGYDQKGRIYKARQWSGPRKPLGKLLASSDQTNYSEWALPSLVICVRLAMQFGEKDVAEKAIALLRPMLKGGYANLDSYLGPYGDQR